MTPSPRMPPHLLALVEEQLHPHADAQQRRSGLRWPAGSGASKPAARQVGGRIAERADAWQHDPGRARQPVGDVITSAGAPAASSALYTLRRLPTP